MGNPRDVARYNEGVKVIFFDDCKAWNRVNESIIIISYFFISILLLTVYKLTIYSHKTSGFLIRLTSMDSACAYPRLPFHSVSFHCSILVSTTPIISKNILIIDFLGQ